MSAKKATAPQDGGGRAGDNPDGLGPTPNYGPNPNSTPSPTPQSFTPSPTPATPDPEPSPEPGPIPGGWDPGPDGFGLNGEALSSPFGGQDQPNPGPGEGKEEGNPGGIAGEFGDGAYGFDGGTGDFDGGTGESDVDADGPSGMGYDNGGGDIQPVILDLAGSGIAITARDQSNVFFDTVGDGYKHRTAWAGAGSGVLAIDANGDGLISERNEIAFTDWDAAATSDLEAIRTVFDTNNNGLLDAGDARWSSFRIVVTNADGTTSVKTLAELGIQSISLTADKTETGLPDGTRSLRGPNGDGGAAGCLS